MSKVFSILTLYSEDNSSSEVFIIPGIPPRSLEIDGFEVENPSSYGRNPEDFLYDHEFDRNIHALYTAYSYGTGQSEDPGDGELLAIALIFKDAGEITEAFSSALDMVESGSFTAENPFWEEPEDEEE